MLAAALWPALTFQARFVSAPEISTLLALALLCGGSACLLDQRAWAYVGVALVPVACGLILSLNACGTDTSPLAWAALAAILWIAAEMSALRSAESTRPLVETVIGLGTWRSRFTSPLFLTAYATSLLPMILGLVQARDLTRTPLQSIAALLIVCAIFTLSAGTRRAGLFMYVAVWLFPLPFAALAAHAYDLAGLTFTLAQAARLLALLGLGYLGLALCAGRAGELYAGPLYWTAYAFAALGVILAIPDRSVAVQTLGIALLGLAWSGWLVHTGRHPIYAAVVGRCVKHASAAWLDVIEILFHYVGVSLLPLWLILLEGLCQRAFAPADCGLTFALLAVPFALAGLRLGRVHAAYRLPWLLAACAMSALGPLAALPDTTLRVATLAVSVAFYVACAVQSRRHEWLWPAALLGPVLLLELLPLIGLPVEVHTTALVGLSLVYGLIALVIQQRGWASSLLRLRQRPAPFATPFLIVGQGLCALGLLYLPAAQSPESMLVCWSLGALQYGASAVISRRSVFSAPLALSLAVAFVSGMVACAIPFRYVGPALLLGVGTFFAAGETLRRTMDAADITAERRPRTNIASWAWPFDACMHVGAVVSFLVCATDIGQMPAWWAIAALYTARTALRREAVWLYPALGSAVAAYLATGVVLLPSMAFSARLLTLTPLAWAMFWLAHGIARRQGENSGLVTACLSVRGVFADRWAAPCLAWGIATLAAPIVLSSGQAVLQCTPLHLAVAVSSLLLLAVFSLFWLSRLLAYAAVAVLTVAIAEALALAGVPWSSLAPFWTAAALVEAFVSTALQRSQSVAARLWAPPLARASYPAGESAAIAAGAGLFVGWSALQSLATTLSLIGACLLMRGIVGRAPLPLRFGLGLLTGAYLCELVYLHLFQLQAFTLPLGIVLLLGAYLEWRRGATTTKAVLELASIAVLLGFTLVQGCGGFGVGDGRFGYDTFLLLESAVVFGAGAVLRWRRLLFAACGTLVTDVGILLIDPVRSMPAWYMVAMIGFAMIGLVMFLEQRRQRIPLWIDDVRERLETWD